MPPHPRSRGANTNDAMRASRAAKPLAADLFCGAGGMSLGLAAAGYEVALGVDSDPAALETFSGHHPALALRRDLGDPDAVAEVADLISRLGVALVAGGPPCQPFSQAGASKIRSLVRAGARPRHDRRRDLWRSFVEIIDLARPDAVLLENVPQIAVSADISVVRGLVAGLEACGYAVHTALLRACDHGVPQLRRRFMLVALSGRGGGFQWPDTALRQVTVRDAIGDLPEVAGGWKPDERGFLDYDPATAASGFARRARRAMRGADAVRVYDHVTRAVRDDDRQIFESMTSSTLYSDLDPSLKRYRDDIFQDKYKRLHWDAPSRSITAHIAQDGYWYIHPQQHRTLTVREAARLQGFPDHVRFAGPPTGAFRQIGNAVPPPLARQVGACIRAALPDSSPAAPRSADIGAALAAWLRGRPPGSLTLPWLAAGAAWPALQAQMLLARAAPRAARAGWEALAGLDNPARSIAAEADLRRAAERAGRSTRVDAVLDAARWFSDNPEALTDPRQMRRAPNVGARTAAIAALADPGAGPAPVVPGRDASRVASRVLGPMRTHRSQPSDARLLITRLLPGGDADVDARAAMSAVVELAASVCLPDQPLCERCPVAAMCAHASSQANASGGDERA